MENALKLKFVVLIKTHFAGMKCGGCVGHVKKILESQPDVMQATVNLATETALVHVLVPKVRMNGKADDFIGLVKALGEKLSLVRLDMKGFRGSMVDLTKCF